MSKIKKIGGYYLLDLGGIDLSVYAQSENKVDLGEEIYIYLWKNSKNVKLSNFRIDGIKQKDCTVDMTKTDDNLLNVRRFADYYNLTISGDGKLEIDFCDEVLSEEQVTYIAKEESVNNKYPSLSIIENMEWDIVEHDASSTQLNLGSSTLADNTEVTRVKNLIESWIKRGFIKYEDELITLALVTCSNSGVKAIFSSIILDNEGQLDTENIISIDLTYNTRGLTVTSYYL